MLLIPLYAAASIHGLFYWLTYICVCLVAATLFDAPTCGALIEAYQMIPNYSWGQNGYAEVQFVYEAANCNVKLCTYYRDKYGTVDSSSWGSLPSAFQISWTSYDCTTVVQRE